MTSRGYGGGLLVAHDHVSAAAVLFVHRCRGRLETCAPAGVTMTGGKTSTVVRDLTVAGSGIPGCRGNDVIRLHAAPITPPLNCRAGGLHTHGGSGRHTHDTALRVATLNLGAPTACVRRADPTDCRFWMTQRRPHTRTHTTRRERA